MKEIKAAHVWSVRGTIPPDAATNRSWSKNVSLDVCAVDIESAIRTAREVHGDLTIHDVVHRGGGSLYVSDALLSVPGDGVADDRIMP